MISFSIVKENILNGGKRVLKVVQFRVKTADVVGPFGEDSHPLKDMIAVYAGTAEVGDNVIIGYFNENQLAAEGEKRMFSLKPDGTLSFAIHLKNDGTCKIGGDADNAVRYSALETAFNKLKTDLNNFITSYNTHIHTDSVFGPTTATPAQATPSSADITPAKINEIKTP